MTLCCSAEFLLRNTPKRKVAAAAQIEPRPRKRQAREKKTPGIKPGVRGKIV
jgi:hypothetical protein